MFSIARSLCLAVALLLISLTASHAQKQKVDLLLVLASDVSRSVTPEKFQLQREGYLKAITNPDVIAVMTSGRNHRIGLMFAEWSGDGEYKVVVGWRIIDGAQSARRFTDELAEAPRSFADRTSISTAIDRSVKQIEQAPFTAERRVIDISGDGTNNSGRDVSQARDDALAKDITINGLVIMTDLPDVMNPNRNHTNPPGGLDGYYRQFVTGGSGSFVEVAKNHNSFGDIIRRKMMAEIALKN